MTGQTHIDALVEIATTGSGAAVPDYQASNLDLAGFQGLFYEEVPNIGQLGDTGVSDSFVDYQTYGSRIAIKQKGTASGMESELRCLQPRSGQESLGYQALIAAGLTNQNVVLKMTWDDGHVEYVRTLIGQPSFVKGQNQNFREAVFTMGINQSPVTDYEAP